MAVFLLQCPHCGNRMKFMPLTAENLQGKSKRCVYCGKSFKAFSHVKRRLT